MNRIEKNYFIIYFCLCANLFNFFNLNGTFLGKIINYTNHFALFILVIFMYLYTFIYKKNKSKKIFKFSVISFVVMILSVSIFSFNRYNESSEIYMLKEVTNYLVILAYFPMCDILIKKSDWTYIVKILTNIATIFSVISIIQSFIFGSLGRTFLFLNVAEQTLLNSSTSLLLGFWRLNQSADFTFFALVIILAADLLFPKDQILKKFKIQILILIFTIIFVSQTRGYYLLLLTVLLFSFIIKNAKKLKVKSRVLLTYLSFPFIIIIIYVTTNKLIGMGNRMQNISIRSSEILYYSQNWLDNGWFGIGIGTGSNLFYQAILGGPQAIYNSTTGKLVNTYSPTDIGILGFIAIFGIVGLLFLLIFIFNIIRYIYISGLQSGALIIILAILGSFITLSIFNTQRIIYLGFYLSFLDYIYFFSKISHKNSEVSNK